MNAVDLNSDLGESFGPWVMGRDEDVLTFVSSANVACGFHGGDPAVMRRTVRLAAERGVAVGAHPSYPDKVGFGRREMNCTPDEIYADVLYQIGALRAFCGACGVPLQHVKPHGAMYNTAGRDEAKAAAIAQAVRDAGGGLILLGLAGSALERAAQTAGVRFAAEAFADRGYMDDGSLVPRSRPGAFVTDPDAAAERVVRMVKEGVVQSVNGRSVPLSPQSICLHGDNPAAVEMARPLRKKIEALGIRIAPLAELVR